MDFKYKAGELVELSAAGKKSQQNTAVVGMIGMIMSIDWKTTYQSWRVSLCDPVVRRGIQLSPMGNSL